MKSEGMVDPLLWVDLETTGLEERDGLILELGMILTDSRLRVVAEFQRVVHVHRLIDRFGDGIPPHVLDMHSRSGLFAEVEQPGPCLGLVEDQALEWVEEHDAGGLHMAGSGVGFDRRWMRRHMPRLAAVFHYRNHDLTTLRRFFREEKSSTPHRALEDLRINVEDYRRYVALRERLLAVA